MLKDEHMTECIYALGRGIFENYMYLCNINSKIGFFENRLLPKADVENYSFKIKENGQIDYNKVIKNSAPETVKNIYIKLSELKDALEFNEDKEIYDMFYQTACQYVHVDVLSAKNYFATINPYDEVDSSLIAYLIIIVLSAMLLSQFGKYRESQEQYCKDISHLCKNKLNERLTFCLMLANQDSEHKNEILDLLKKRIETEFGNLK